MNFSKQSSDSRLNPLQDGLIDLLFFELAEQLVIVLGIVQDGFIGRVAIFEEFGGGGGIGDGIVTGHQHQ